MPKKSSNKTTVRKTPKQATRARSGKTAKAAAPAKASSAAPKKSKTAKAGGRSKAVSTRKPAAKRTTSAREDKAKHSSSSRKSKGGKRSTNAGRHPAASTPPRPQLSVVLVANNDKAAVFRALEALNADGYSSVLSSSRGRREVIVVDCGSSNGTGKAVAKRFPSVIVINRPDDVGFSRAANLGLEIARGEYVLLLNPDVVVPKDAVSTMIGYLAATPYAAAVSPELRAKDDSPARAPRPFPSLKREFIANWSAVAGQFGLKETPFTVPTDASPVDGIPSACMLIRSTALRQIGGLDGRNLAAFAELDWCRRADKAGWEVHYDPRLRVTDFGAADTGDNTDARWSYFRKHHGNVAATLVEAMHVLRSAVDSAKNSNVVQSMKQIERFRGRHDGGHSLDV